MENLKTRAYIMKEFILWKLAVFRLWLLMGFAWVVYRVNPTQEYRTLYLSVRHSYERNKTL